jgi:CBS domain-containing protein
MKRSPQGGTAMLLHAAAPGRTSSQRPLQRGDRTVRDLMSRDPVTILEQASLEDAADLLCGYDISALAVVDDHDRLVGVISQTDLVLLRGRGAIPRDWHRLTVANVMTSPPLVIGADDVVADAARRMTDEAIHRLFVVDADGAPIGVVSASDIVTEIAEVDG